MHCYGASPTVEVAHFMGNNGKYIVEDLSVEGSGRLLFATVQTANPLEYLDDKLLGLSLCWAHVAARFA